MKHLFLIVLFVLSILQAYSQIKQVSILDTVICGSDRVIIEIPTLTYKWSKIFRYEEGFFKDYPFMDRSFISIHYGTMQRVPIVQCNDTLHVSEKYQIGNIGYTIRGVCGDKIYREDRYRKEGINIMYENADKSKRNYLDSIMDNIKIERIQ